MVPFDEPISRFVDALARARAVEPHDPTAMTLATAGPGGRPSARVVLLKTVDARGFVFYTNRESRKALDLAKNPYAALCVHWPASEQQVRIEGPVELVSDEESDAYFVTRPRLSRIGAWASRQSAPLGSRAELDARVAEIDARYPNEIPRPPQWGGYRLIPELIEFWSAGHGRLHDRVLYTRTGEGWKRELLNP